MRRNVKILISVLLGFLLAAPVILAQSALSPSAVVARGQSQGHPFRVVQLVDGLDHPWAMAFLPDGSILVTERPGRLFLLNRREGEIVEVTGLPRISANGQGGLLDVALHPNYERNGWIYLTYSSRYRLGDGTTLARARLNNNRLVELEELFRMNESSVGGRHFGSRLVFGEDGKLYMTIGERGDRDRAQDTGDHAGSVLRLNDDGSVPEDNPLVGRPGALPEIFSYGHRNAQGMAVNPATGQIWLHEHGPRGGDEVNIVRAGANYGWPVISYGAEYASGRQVGEGTGKPGMEQPVLHWTPSIAPSGMSFYGGTAFPHWTGSIFVGALAGEHLRRVALNGNSVVGQEVLLQGALGRIRDVRTGPDGLLYLLTDESNGGIYVLEP